MQEGQMPELKLEDLEKELKNIYAKTAPSAKFSRGGVLQSGEKRESFDEEAIVYVWHEKDVFSPAKMSPGHAAMKLSRYSDKTNKNEMVRYISWWPGDGASKNTKPQPGARVLNTREDRLNEISSKKDIKLILKLQFIRLASEKLPGGKEDFQRLAEAIWQDLSSGQEDRLKKAPYNCKENFANLADIDIKPRPDQKLLFPHNYEKELSPVVFANMQVVKQPYARVYVPCSCLPASILPGEVYLRRSPWGLSLDAMNLKFRSYEAGLRLYKMQAFDDNCIGAVWECMKSGLAEVITNKFRPAKGVVSTIVHFKSLLPSDAINASKALAAEILRMNKQQQYLDLRVYEYRDRVSQFAAEKSCFEGNWRNYVRLSARWRDFSSASGLRPFTLMPIDKLVDKYDRNERLLGKEDKHSVQDLLRLEAVWETRCHSIGVTGIKKLIKDISSVEGQLEDFRLKGRTAPAFLSKKKARLDKELEAAEKNVKPALTAWEQELEQYEKVRRSRARILIDLHEAVFAYVFNHTCSKLHSPNPDRRYIATILLGQFVCWLFAEVVHDNLSVRFHGMTEGGVTLTMDEKDRCLGDAFPNLRIKDHYHRDEVKEKKFLKDHKKRDRILM